MKIMIIGATGTFGKRLSNHLAQYTSHELLLVGRDCEKLKVLSLRLQQLTQNNFQVSRISYLPLDIFASNFADRIIDNSPDLVVNMAGPYQTQADQDQFPVANACLIANCHYVDLADDRDYVKSFASNFDMQAKEKQLIFITGASTVPALTEAVLSNYQPAFKQIDELYYGISPGNKTDRGEGTIGSILSYLGQPFNIKVENNTKQIFGWQDLTRYDFGYPIGKRWMSNCNISDLDLIPAQFSNIQSIRFQAGLELSILHISLWLLSFISRFGIIKNWIKYSKLAKTISLWFRKFGTDTGGMFVKITGEDLKGEKKILTWTLIAESGVGPNIPVISTELVVKKLMESELNYGAYPCVRLFDLSEFLAIASRWGIYQRVVRS